MLANKKEFHCVKLFFAIPCSTTLSKKSASNQSFPLSYLFTGAYYAGRR